VVDPVIVGVDGSDTGERAARFAQNLARQSEVPLIVAYVVPWSPYAVQTAAENERRHASKVHEVQAAHEQIVDPLVERLRESGLDVAGVVRHGHPAEMLCDIAKEHGSQHIVVGRRGESRVRALLFGSTTGNLIQIATVPVTVVP
jgi:nucleotide-binding universal stress UspA family protein